MIVVISTSSPMASVAVYEAKGELLHADIAEAKQNGSAVCLGFIDSFGIELSAVHGFVADTGPGSFTGVRVGVMLAKTLAWSHGVPAAGISSFDLIDAEGIVSLPGRRGEWLRRLPGEEPKVEIEFAGTGYGSGSPMTNYPNAARAGKLIGHLRWVSAMELMPDYILSPSISTPKKPYLPGAVQ